MVLMSTCPSCNAPLSAQAMAGGRSLACLRCGGRAVSLPVLRRHADPRRVASVWREAQDQTKAGGAACPTCARPMHLVAVGEQEPRLWLDVCLPCQHVWLDGGELERLAADAPPPFVAQERALPLEGAVMLAQLRAQQSRESGEDAFAGNENKPGSFQTAAAWLGLPGELDEPEYSKRPLVTWGTAAIIALLAAVAFLEPDANVRWGLVPDAPLRNGGLTFLTSLVPHGGPLHLLGNLYFLLVFGDNVEDAIGQARWLVLFLAAGLAGGVAQVLLDPSSTVPVVGVSGAVSGLLAFYVVTFPRARLGFFVRVTMRGTWLRMPAWTLFALWTALQFIGAWLQVKGCSNTSAVAHLGGAAVGAAAALWWRGRAADRRRGPASAAA